MSRQANSRNRLTLQFMR